MEESGLDFYELDGLQAVYDSEGGVHAQDEGDAEDEEPSALLERMTEWSEFHPHRDMTFAEYLAQEGVSAEEAAGAIGYVEGFNAADHRVIGVQSLAMQQRAEDEIEGDRVFHIKGGYLAFTRAMEAKARERGAAIYFGHKTTKMIWSHGRVYVLHENGESVEARAAVITLPLGVLQARDVVFEPAPEAILQQADRMRMGHVCRISLVFDGRFWAEQDRDLEKLSFLFPEGRRVHEGARFEVFWTPHPSLEPVMTAWVGGPAADAFAKMSAEEVAAIAVRDLAYALGREENEVQQRLRGHAMHDWTSDALARGAYSYVPAGAADASEKMTLPVEETLFFAGEHTDVTGHWGTVHGAIRSGVRAADQVVRALKIGK
jgi:monoamine oxidase